MTYSCSWWKLLIPRRPKGYDGDVWKLFNNYLYTGTGCMSMCAGWKCLIHDADIPSVLYTYATWAHGQVAYFRPLLCLMTQSTKIWRTRFHINLHLFYNFTAGGIWTRLLYSFSLLMCHRTWTAVVLVLLSAFLALQCSEVLELLHHIKDFKNKLFALTAPKQRKYPGN